MDESLGAWYYNACLCCIVWSWNNQCCGVCICLFARGSMRPCVRSWVKRTVSGFQKNGRLGDMGEVWASNRTLLVQALPFAITLCVLPYVVRAEKFIVSIELGLDSAALFHVAQLAWLAGLVIPRAMRAALLSVLGKVRHSKQEFTQNMNASLDVCMGLLPVGIFSGAAIVGLFLPSPPEQYVDGSMGASAVDLFTVLLWDGALLCFQPLHTRLCKRECILGDLRFSLSSWLHFLQRLVCGLSVGSQPSG